MNTKLFIMLGATAVGVFFLMPLLKSGRAAALFNLSGVTQPVGSTTQQDNKLTKYAKALGSFITVLQQSKSRPPAIIDYKTNPATGAPYDWT